MTFSFFLSIYSRCGAPASWAARHTTVCLDELQILLLQAQSQIPILADIMSTKACNGEQYVLSILVTSHQVYFYDLDSYT